MTTVATRQNVLTSRRGPKPKLGQQAARALTEQIKHSTHDLLVLVAKAHEGKVWLALGYPSWAEYCRAELKISESRSYQLLQTSKVVSVVNSEAGHAPDLLELVPTARQTQRIKDNLPVFRRQFRKALNAGLSPSEAMSTAVAALPAQTKEQAMADHPAGKALQPCPTCGGTGKVAL